MKALLSLVLLFMTIFTSTAQVVITNKNFSIGSTGRIGVGFSPNGEGNTGKSLNLSGQGSIGGRMEQTDYMDLLPALHFTPVFSGKDSTSIFFQARIGVYSANGQFLGNISSRSTDGLTFILPETFIEAKNIMGSPWSAWAGARYRRYDDIHINDYFYFDDHSSQGFGVSYKKTEFTMLFPASTDSSATNSYIYTISMNGTRTKAFRQRLVFIGEHSIVLNNGGIIKLLAEFHHLSATSKNAIPTYSADYGWVAGIKYSTPLKTFKKGSFNQLSVRYGKGIANGGDNGNTQTWQTYGAPDAQTGKYTNAYSFTAVEHVLLNLTNRFSINGYSI
ncbi:MAG: carbohydrate porin, partial [Bacteroidota bacterium]|nr:carbohydrate porin [Bacteroidota bacterium]